MSSIAKKLMMSAGAGGGGVEGIVWAFPYIATVDLINLTAVNYAEIYKTGGPWGDDQFPRHMTWGDDDKLYVITSNKILSVNPSDFSPNWIYNLPTAYHNISAGLTYADGFLYTSFQPGTSSAPELKIRASDGNVTTISGVETRGYRYDNSYNGVNRHGWASLKYTFGFNGFDFNTGTDFVTDNDDIQGVRNIFYYKGYWYGADLQNGMWHFPDGATTFPQFPNNAFRGSNVFIAPGGIVYSRDFSFPNMTTAQLSSSGISSLGSAPFPSGAGNPAGFILGSDDRVYTLQEGFTLNSNRYSKVYSFDPANIGAGIDFVGEFNWTTLFPTPASEPGNVRNFVSKRSKASLQWDAP